MEVSRRALLQAALATAAAVAAESRPERVLLIIADHGKSAAIDALQEGSAAFERAYTACPQHHASIGAILSGRFPHAQTPPEAMLPSMLRAAGIPCDVIARDAESAMSRAPLTHPAALTLITATCGAMPRTHPGASQDSWYEEAVRVPLLMRWPERIRPSKLDILASNVDIAPTVLALCGVPLPADVHGRDLSAFVTGDGGERPESIYGEGGLGTAWEWRMLVRGLDKAVFDVNGALEHLYNLGQDPGEQRDLAGLPDQERRVDELSAVAQQMRRRIGDRMDPSGLRRR